MKRGALLEYRLVRHPVAEAESLVALRRRVAGRRPIMAYTH